jgi:Bacterial protein of unknown function (DUF882)
MFMPIRSTIAVAVAVASLATLVPTAASASPRPQEKRPRREARVSKRDAVPRGCVKAPVQIVAGAQSATLSLARCDGVAATAGLERLSALARARGAVRLDARLVEQLELAVDHFRKGVEPTRVQLVSGYRPESAGSYHAKGKALDFRLDGVANEAVVAFCKTLPDTGCGYYPNSGFVHMDVREPGTGHVAWTDVSRPGQAPRYVAADAPPAPSEAAASPAPSEAAAPSARPEATLPALPTHHARADRKEKREAASRASRDDRLHAI